MTLFAVLLNCHNVDGVFDLFEEIMNIYADPYNNQSSQRLSLLLDQSNVDEFPVEPYLDEIEQDEEEPHFLDEIDITNDAIIHQSPFNVKACERMPLLKQLIRKEPMKKKPTNPLFSIAIVHLFYKWFAYVPLWSVIDSVDLCHLDMPMMAKGFRPTTGNLVMKKTRLKPGDFLLKVYLHTVSRLKANDFDVTQSSRCRKVVQDEPDTLNAKENWRGKGRSKTKANRRRHYFDDSIAQTTACKLIGEKPKQRKVQFDQASSCTASDYSSVHTLSDLNDASSSSLSTHSVFNQSFGFSIKSSNPAELNRGNVSILGRSPSSSSSSSSCSNFDGPLHSRQVEQDYLLTSVPYVVPSEPEATDTEENVRRSSRHRTPNPKYANDYISPIISPNLLSRALSPKRPLSSSNDTISANVMEKISDEQRKKIKTSLLHSSKKQQSRFSKQPFTTTLGSLNLTWPRYGIKNGIYEGQSFSITRTCPVDTGLFVLYHAYKAGSDGFRKPMQEFDINSECTCVACPKRIRKHSSADITLRDKAWNLDFNNFMTENV
ncbi:unnamed protein product [Rotaria sordida]|uniref:Uncharacterized protein n=1 Tax=Rotaria sordida TaxID=392033 RepID=A0A819UHW3_9BILA|nr:unnamed protein product [Rotaria sordida]